MPAPELIKRLDDGLTAEDWLERGAPSRSRRTPDKDASAPQDMRAACGDSTGPVLRLYPARAIRGAHHGGEGYPHSPAPPAVGQNPALRHALIPPPSRRAPGRRAHGSRPRCSRDGGMKVFILVREIRSHCDNA